MSGVTLNTVHYVVTNSATPAVTISEGDLPTPGTAKDFSFGLSLPVGTGYTISLSAASAETGDNITCGGSYGTFNVAPNTATNFALTLTCHDDTNGQIIGGVDVKTDACPKIVFDYVVATPGAQDVGKDIAVLGKAHDLDGKALTYTWKVATPATGTFTPVAGATSSLHCAAAKAGEIVTITANNGECTKALTTTVSCKSVLCGNGVVDTADGETCDIALPGPCPADCNSICGDGTAEPRSRPAIRATPTPATRRARPARSYAATASSAPARSATIRLPRRFPPARRTPRSAARAPRPAR